MKLRLEGMEADLDNKLRDQMCPGCGSIRTSKLPEEKVNVFRTIVDWWICNNCQTFFMRNLNRDEG